jgi:hypothetical protein
MISAGQAPVVGAREHQARPPARRLPAVDHDLLQADAHPGTVRIRVRQGRESTLFDEIAH